VFDGLCGESDGALAFMPNLAGKAPEAAKGGLLDGEPVSLSIRKDSRASPFYLATYRLLA
jgi:hypothetical protein